MATGLPIILWDSRLKDATPVASSTAAGYDVRNLTDFRAYTWWRPTALPATVTVDCGSPRAADCLGVYGHDLGSKGATIQVQASTDNFVASNVAVTSFTPTHDRPIVRTWPSVAYRYWRLRVTGSTAPSLAIVAIGAALAFPRPLARGFDPLGRAVVGAVNRSEDGHALGRAVYAEQWEARLSFRLLTWEWVRSTFLPAWQAHLRSAPFLFAWDPVEHPEETRLVTAGEAFRAPTEGAFSALELDVMGVA
jgi:hypothetical protein